MTQDAPLWLGVFGAVTGVVGLLTAIASAWYTRRAALAAEGPAHPSVEVHHHQWDNENPGWYRMNIVIRNRTGEAWELVSARAPRLLRTPIYANHTLPYEGEHWNPTMIPLNQIAADRRPNRVDFGFPIGPAGAQHFHGNGGDVLHVSIILKPSAFSRATKRLCVSLSLEAKTEVVRHKDITVTRRLRPIPRIAE